jgi:cysteinyl-tRNA synthetase, unknown class
MRLATSSIKRYVAVLAVLAVLALLGHERPGFAQTPAATPATAGLLAAAKSWGYQLQNVDPDEIAAAPYDVFVIDYSRDGSGAEALTADDLDKLKVKPDGERRIVLSYLSIGEAETYRYYWKWYWGWFFGWLAPSWRGKQNAEWRGNYGVRYWEDDWQRIIFRGDNSYLDRIIKAGFDGVYLDKVDEYVDMAKENPNARADMIAFVQALAARARAIKPGFLIVPQNAEELLTDQAYRAAIDGLGKEDLLFGEIKDQQPNTPQSISDNVARLKLLTADRKPVFAVEYLDDPKEIERARKRLEGYGFIPYFADRALDNMRIGDLAEPGRKPGKK